MQRSLSATTLLFASVSAILGSGWLFTAYYTSLLAGPSAILSWILGGGAVIVVAFVFAELSAMLPITGSSTRIPQYTHGTLVSFIFSWMIWLSYAALVSTEAQAIIQYLSFYGQQVPILSNMVLTTGKLTAHGYFIATGIMLTISAVNIFSLRWLMRCNNFLTALKIIIPVVVCIAVLVLHSKHLEPALHPAGQSFMPYGWHGVFAAIASGGIVFAFNGFKQACEMAGEAKNPSVSVPLAIVGSVALTLVIYIVMQVTFLKSLNHSNLVLGFSHLQLQSSNSPFASILAQDHLNHLQSLLYIGAVIGPLAAGLMYMGSASRSLFGKSSNGYLPVFFQKLTSQGNPIYGILTTFGFGMLMFAPLPGWDKMITFLTSLMAISYAIAPICLLTLRKQLPEQARPFKLPFANIWGNLSFAICNLMTYFSGWDIISKLSIALLLGFAILFSYYLFSKRGREITFDWRASLWIWPYFAGLSYISYLGNFGHGHGVLPPGWDYLVIILFSCLIMQLALRFRLEDDETRQYIKALNLNSRSE